MNNSKEIGFYESQTAQRVIRKEMNIAEATSAIGSAKLVKALRHNAAPSEMVSRVLSFNTKSNSLKHLAAKAPTSNPYTD